jgi:hypothetical protein
MAYDEKTGSNAENCTVHMWPRGRPGGSMRSIGNTEHEQCNNCLAMRITFSTEVRIDGVWTRLTDTKIVEPQFKPEVNHTSDS